MKLFEDVLGRHPACTPIEFDGDSIHEAVLATGGTLPILGGYLADRSGEPFAPLWLVFGVASLVALAALALVLRAPPNAAEVSEA